MCAPLTTIAFDADDTLWHNERFFQITQERFADLLAPYTAPETLMARLLDAEKRNIQHYGFGIKGFVLSMIETAIEVTNKEVPASVIAELLQAGQDMLQHPVELLPQARETVEQLRAQYRVLLITKGDLLDQERKIAQSGLDHLFHGVEIVSHKVPHVYGHIFDAHGEGAAQSMMVGNSMRSDVLPVVEIGGWGVFVPHGLEWDIEKAEPPLDAARYRQISTLGDLPNLLHEID